MKRFFLIFSLSFLFPPLILAQLTAELDSISVTSSRITSTISESGKSVAVITQKEIEAMPVTSVDDLLKSIPGINVNSRQGFGVQSDVGMRGSTFSQVLFMLDNVPLNDPLTAHFNTNIPVSLGEIGQIEIIRGPSSASFGADAVGGVVHIKTKMYMQREIRKSNGLLSYANADLSYGEHNLRMGDLSFELQQNRWRLSTSIRGVYSDGERLPNPGFEAGVSDESQYDNYFELANFSTSLSYRMNDRWSWYVRGGVDERDFSARYFYTRSEFDESTERISSRWVLGAITRDTGQQRTEMNISYRNVNDIFDFNSRIGIPANEHTTDQLFLNLSHQLDLGSLGTSSISNSRLMIGAQMLDKQIESTDRGNHQDRMGGIYLIGSAGWESGFSMTASTRLQFDTQNDPEFLPQLSMAYNRGELTLRSSIGRAIRMGDFTERFISSQIDNLAPLRNIGNPDLLPERSWTFDLGLDWRPTNRTLISPTLFYRTSSDLIDYALTNSSNINNADNLQPDEDYFYTLNIASSNTAGVEFLASQRFSLGSQKTVRTDAAYTWIRTSGNEGEVSKYIANHPKHQLSFTVDANLNMFRITSESSYRVRSTESADLIAGDVPDGYFLTNLKLQYSFSGWPLTAYVQGLNLTDTQYQEILGAPMPGRWLMGGLKVRIR
ncbi:MAG: TonB-dependent receptor plug domain-containing protein [Bacteroidota bacterium]